MSALTALLVFLISFALVAVLFRMPVSFALGTSSLLVLAYAGFQLVTVPSLLSPVSTASRFWRFPSTFLPVLSWNTVASPKC